MVAEISNSSVQTPVVAVPGTKLVVGYAVGSGETTDGSKTTVTAHKLNYTEDAARGHALLNNRYEALKKGSLGLSSTQRPGFASTIGSQAKGRSDAIVSSIAAKTTGSKSKYSALKAPTLDEVRAPIAKSGGAAQTVQVPVSSATNDLARLKNRFAQGLVRGAVTVGAHMVLGPAAAVAGELVNKYPDKEVKPNSEQIAALTDRPANSLPKLRAAGQTPAKFAERAPAYPAGKKGLAALYAKHGVMLPQPTFG